ncbi:MAG: DUF302 domain-containing protein [Gammaproteobacteria bacterium]|jgi:uncharacterized protein (DUF302 family)|nr:DUF302 domain-containing protein [Gammaproteobacteria bacterium]MBT7307343.1 DUF302 domain-containing protein [Gammaproteobacteria bacterium]
MRKTEKIITTLLLLLPLSTLADGLWAHHEVEEEFDTIKEYIEEGITNQGLVVAHRSDVGGMLERTGKDLVAKVSKIHSTVEEKARSMIKIAREKIGIEEGNGAETDAPASEAAASATFTRSEVIEFCSATLSRKMTDADPANVIFCPYSIALYSTTAAPNIVHISYLQLSKIGSSSSREVLLEVEAMLSKIVTEATE